MLTRPTVAAMAAAALFATAPAIAQPAPAGVPIPCERACMEGLAGKVLAALAAHDARSLPLAKNARYTENGQEMGFDNGLWQTASKVGAYRHVFADPASGQLGVFATMDENGHGLVLGMRVKIELGLISEIELVTYRTGAGPAWNDAGYANLEKMKQPKALWTQPATGKRLSRQELAKAANYYFDGIQNNDGKGYYPFTADCDRLENGTATTNNPGIVKMGPVDIGGMGCKAQFETGLYGVVTLVHDRRFEVIDEERQAVFSLAVFDHCGCKKSLTMPNGTRVDVGFFNKPSSILLAEAFKIDGGLIRQVEAVGTSVPYHMRPGWER
jgi:hypothetical protein